MHIAHLMPNHRRSHRPEPDSGTEASSRDLREVALVLSASGSSPDQCNDLTMTVSKHVSRFTLIVATSLALSACVAVESPEPPVTSASSSAQGNGPAVEASPDASESTTPSTRAQREAAYDGETANWSEPLRPGYSWPAFSDLPKGVGPQLAEGQDARGAYRCILLDAAWHAYDDGDEDLATTYVLQADEYAIAENPSLFPVTRHEDTVFGEVDIANQICRGVVGELSQ